jgi:hypothetical protein
VDLEERLISNVASEEEMAWVRSRQDLKVAFVATPRFLPKKIVNVSDLYQNYTVPENVHWPLERLVRLFFLQKMNKEDIEILFDTSELNESVALYSSLPFLNDPEHWVFRATEAVRSNVGNIFDALAFQNPYPYQYFSEQQWNQLVLKCIFNDKGIHQIWGLKERSNANLALSLSDFAHERWAAGRKVPAQVWRLVSDFVDDRISADLEKLWTIGDEEDKIAVSLVAQESGKLSRLKIEMQEFNQSKPLSWSELENN